ncbi:MAG: Rrf2 family transcriptional regulator [Proteobacteria bacterium]|nr:Rrf2 family transcriptional regulator [Pseudomonadota bacterium]
MKLSSKCRYGIRAVIEIARNYQQRPTKRKEIAASQNLDDSYLENILIDLKNKNIVSALRGAKGGFVLKRAPEEITLLNVIESLQGDLSPAECLSTPAVCDRVENCVTRPVWQKMKNAQEDVLKNVTIKDLLEKEMSGIPLTFDI